MQLSNLAKLVTLLSFVAAQDVFPITTTETQQSPPSTDSSSSTSSTASNSDSSSSSSSSASNSESTSTSTSTTTASDSSTSGNTSTTTASGEALLAQNGVNSTESRTIVSVSTEQVAANNNNNTNGSTSVDLSSRDIFPVLRSTVTFFENSTTGSFTTWEELSTAPPAAIFRNVTGTDGAVSLIQQNVNDTKPLFTQTDSAGHSVTYYMGDGAMLRAFGVVPGALVAGIFGLLW